MVVTSLIKSNIMQGIFLPAVLKLPVQALLLRKI